MRQVIHKVFLAWEFEKEEKWLNEMSAKGLALVGVGCCKYTFEECLPGEYTIRLELLKNRPKHLESQQYLRFMEETGVQYLGSILRWVHFRKKRTEGEFDLFSDNESKCKHLNLILSLLTIVFVLNLWIGCWNLFLYFRLDSMMNLCGLINIALGIFCAWGSFQIWRNKKKLQKEMELFE